MRQLLYASTTRRYADETFLQDILVASRRNNTACGVTGILLYIEGGFMQVLEGEDNAVAETYGRIQADKRHWNTMVLLDHAAPRGFSEWSMGFERPTSNGDGLFSLTQDAIAGRLKRDAPPVIMTLLKTFYRVNSS